MTGGASLSDRADLRADLRSVLATFIRSEFVWKTHSQDERVSCWLEKCIALHKRDDPDMGVLLNRLPSDVKGRPLCESYPMKIIIPHFRVSAENSETRSRSGRASDEENYQALETSLAQAAAARCRQRFPIPAFSFNGKYVCRSATLSTEFEITVRTSAVKSGHAERYREADKDVLRFFDVDTICDLMVEDTKIMYNFIKCSSSEKADSKKRYKDLFELIHLPYPGVEAFEIPPDDEEEADWAVHGWTDFLHSLAPSVRDAKLRTTSHSAVLPTEWHTDYMKWDLYELTVNYLSFLHDLLLDGTSASSCGTKRSSHRGLLVHCISGWDRTPLFISLLRVSLWADGSMHQSLSPLEMLFFTVCYDWYLFGHQLRQRLREQRDILRFCFDFLQHITHPDFATRSRSKKGVQNGGVPSAENGGVPNGNVPSQNGHTQLGKSENTRKPSTGSSMFDMDSVDGCGNSLDSDRTDVDADEERSFTIQELHAASDDQPESPDLDQQTAASHPDSGRRSQSSTGSEPIPIAGSVGSPRGAGCPTGGSHSDSIMSSWVIPSCAESFQDVEQNDESPHHPLASESRLKGPPEAAAAAAAPATDSRAERLLAVRRLFLELYLPELAAHEESARRRQLQSTAAGLVGNAASSIIPSFHYIASKLS